MWSKTWGYKEGLTIGAGLLIIGTLLQVTVSGIQWSLLAYPMNIIVLLVYIIGLACMHLLRKRIYLFGWMSRHQAAVTSLLWVAIITVLMGLIRQSPSVSAEADILGFSRMIASWPFVLLYFWMVTVLGLTILRAILPFRWRSLSFTLNHVGLFIALTAATLGNADMQRLKMTTHIGNPEWRATDEKGNIIELPLAIELKDFKIDEYPPKLMLIDNETGRTLPEKSPINLLLEEGVEKGQLRDWQISIRQSIPAAASVATQDTLKFTEFHSVGATYAVYLEAVNSRNGVKKEGWVSCGSFLFPYKAIRLDSLTSLVMPEREPQRFASDVKVYSEKGTVMEGTIEVNRPLEVEGWKIYQLSYDETKGRWSDVSIFELVRDPWLPVVYAGIMMMMAGALCLFVNAQKRKKGAAEVENEEEEDMQ